MLELVAGWISPPELARHRGADQRHHAFLLFEMSLVGGYPIQLPLDSSPSSGKIVQHIVVRKASC
jgi:hypothetical protein